MALRSRYNEPRTNRYQPESHSRVERGQTRPHPDFQIAPESGTFLTDQHRYLTTFRHVNCAEYCTSGTPFPADCSGSFLISIMSRSNRLNAQGYSRMMQVCPGGCNEKNKDKNANSNIGSSLEESSISNEDIAQSLYEHTRALCKVMHPRKAQVIEIVDTRVIWSGDSPIPAYFSPSKKNIVPHSSAVTSGHLALIQARGQADNIQLDFRTYETV
ncbi:hypothetical protein F4823DRAFT_629138 [Ustulina deusta]|nr:hypothetical protein F4823DRAFT_629138 [Ustulina deusta]